MLREVLL